VTDSGGSPELIEHGKSGLIVRSKSAEEIASAIRKLFDDADLLAEIKEKANVRICNDFHVNETIEKHISLYQKLV